jgi:hypothetical protein
MYTFHARVFEELNKNRPYPDTVSTLGDHCGAGKLTFGDPFQDSGVVGVICVERLTTGGTLPGSLGCPVTRDTGGALPDSLGYPVTRDRGGALPDSLGYPVTRDTGGALPHSLGYPVTRGT